MPDFGAASVNDVCELLTPVPVTITSYLPGASEAGSFSVRVHLPAFTVKVLLSAVFLAPCRRTVIVRVVFAPTVPGHGDGPAR